MALVNKRLILASLLASFASVIASRSVRAFPYGQGCAGLDGKVLYVHTFCNGCGEFFGETGVLRTTRLGTGSPNASERFRWDFASTLHMTRPAHEPTDQIAGTCSFATLAFVRVRPGSFRQEYEGRAAFETDAEGTVIRIGVKGIYKHNGSPSGTWIATTDPQSWPTPLKDHAGASDSSYSRGTKCGTRGTW